MTETLVIFSDGKLELPKIVQQEMQLTEGARLRLVSASPRELHLEPLTESQVKGSIWLGNRWWIDNDDWRSLRGILSDGPDLNHARAEDRARELEHDERKFSPLSES
jgi:hypothetical protein